jgi:hypothetical protein
MSTSALPTPIAANSSSAAAASGAPPTMVSGVPQRTTPTPRQRGVTAIPGDRRGEHRTDQRAEPDRRVEHADVGVPAAEEVDRHDDHEHGRAAAQERLHEAERGDQPEPRIRPERGAGPR